MAKSYEPGTIVGEFEILETAGRRRNGNRTPIVIYHARCRFCGREFNRSAAELRSKYGCGCAADEPKNGRYISSMTSNKPAKPEPWMDEGEIYRSWKSMRDRTEGVAVLAQLNGVSERVIEEIIAAKKRQERKAEAF